MHKSITIATTVVVLALLMGAWIWFRSASKPSSSSVPAKTEEVATTKPDAEVQSAAKEQSVPPVTSDEHESTLSKGPELEGDLAAQALQIREIINQDLDRFTSFTLTETFRRFNTLESQWLERQSAGKTSAQEEALLQRLVSTGQELLTSAQSYATANEKRDHVAASLEKLSSSGAEKFPATATDFRNLHSDLDEVDRSIKRGEFGSARGRLEELGTEASRLQTILDDAYAELSERARVAFETAAGNREEHIIAALEMRPGDETMRNLLDRSIHRRAVVDTLQVAEKSFQNETYDAALAAFESAYDLDPATEGLRERLEEVRLVLDQVDFDRLQRQAWSFFQEQKFLEAIQTAQMAVSLGGKRGFDIQSPQSLIERSEAEKRALDIRLFREQISQAAATADWKRVISLTGALFQLVPQDPWGTEQKDMAVNALREESTLQLAVESADELLKRPHSTLGKAEIDHMKTQVAAVLARYDPVPTHALRDRMVQLEALSDVFSQPVQITFVSDNRTDVMLRGHGRLGRFREQSIALAPGTYSAHCSRNGYRDKLVKVVVVPQQSPTSPIKLIVEDRL